MNRYEIQRQLDEQALIEARDDLEARVKARTADLSQQAVMLAQQADELKWQMAQREQAEAEQLALQEQVLAAQNQLIQELLAPVIPVLAGVIIMPLVGSIDTRRAKDVTRTLLAGGHPGHYRRFCG